MSKKAIVHLVEEAESVPKNTLCGEAYGSLGKGEATREYWKSNCLLCLRAMVLRMKQDAEMGFEEQKELVAGLQNLLAEKDRRIDTLEKGIDVLLDKCLESRTEKERKTGDSARGKKPKTGRVALPDGTVRLMGVSAAARWLGCTTPALSQIARGMPYRSGTLEQRAREAFPALFGN